MAASLSLAAAHAAPPATNLDPRCLRSRAALCSAFEQEFAQVGDLSKVTVTAVSHRAGLTRRTFYAHYKDIAQLTAAVETNTINELAALVEELCANELDEVFAAIDRTEPVPGSVEILAYMKERREFFAALMGPGGDPAFAQRLKARSHTIAAAHALRGIGVLALGKFFDYYISFAVGAVFSVIERWVAGGMEEPVETLARLISLLVFVRPGDLYNNSYDIDIQGYGLSLMLDLKENQ